MHRIFFSLVLAMVVLSTSAGAATFSEFVNAHYQYYLTLNAPAGEVQVWWGRYTQQSWSADRLSTELHIALANVLRAKTKPLYETCRASVLIIGGDYWDSFDCVYGPTKTNSYSRAIARISPVPYGAFTKPLYQCTRLGTVRRSYVSVSPNCEGEPANPRQIIGYAANKPVRGAYYATRFSHRHPQIESIATRMTLSTVPATLGGAPTRPTGLGIYLYPATE